MDKDKMAQKLGPTMNIQNDSQLQCWIGLAHVKPQSNNRLLGDASGAFVPVLALASGIENFISMATHFLDSCSFETIEINDVELYKDRLLHSTVCGEIKELRGSLSAENPISVDVFQAYT